MYEMQTRRVVYTALDALNTLRTSRMVVPLVLAA
jgi:hypothetical protein